MKRSFVRIVIVLISVNAAIAVFVLLSGDIGETEGKILATSLLATAAAVIGMVCAPALSSGRAWLIPQLGIGASVVAFALATFLLWSEIDPEWLGKSTGTAFVVAGFSALACVLSAWPVEGRASWVSPAGNVLIALAASMILAGMWFEIDSSGYWRVFAVVAVLLAAAALAIPVLHRSRGPSDADPVSHCPFCGADLSARTGEATTCPTCGRRFTVRPG